ARLHSIFAAYGTTYVAAHRGDLKDDHTIPMLKLQLDHHLGYFAPYLMNNSGGVDMTVHLIDRVHGDVCHDAIRCTFECTKEQSTTYPAQRWRKFVDNIINPRPAVVRPFFLKWLCNDWNESHEEHEQVRSITLYHMAQTVNFPEKSYTAVDKNNLQRQTCPVI